MKIEEVGEYISFNGKRIARQTVPGTSSTARYYFSDHLGSTSIITDAGGVVQNESYFYPYGGEIQVTTGDPNHYKFTGKERDSETNLDYFGARYLASSMGRWMSPDPSPMGVAVTDPQSWNLYSYVRNRPTRSVDTNGNWATDVHAQIVTYALQDYVSAGELDVLRSRQYTMDADQSNQNNHAMANGGQSSQAALNGMWDFVSSEMGIASQNVGANGLLNATGLNALGDAIHTVEDFTSPEHTDSSFMPMVWRGGYWPPWKLGPGLVHVLGEGSPEVDWARIGYAVRLTMAAYLQSGAGCEAGRKCLTAANFESEVTKNINSYVNNYYMVWGNHPGSTDRAFQIGAEGRAEAARQCALGNPAACGE